MEGEGTGIKVCEALGVEVWLPKRHYLSFTNSPYYAHHRLAAIDVYPPRGEHEVLSPIEGKLLLHRVVGGEHILGFRSGDAYVRILHVRPNLNVGETISVGDPLGEVTWSPTFFKWTDPHLHLEIRSRNNFVGARGCARLSVHNDLVSFLRNNVDLGSGPQKYIVDLIMRDRYVVLKPHSGSVLPALTVSTDDALGIMEGGIPYYGHAGVILLRNSADYPVHAGSGVRIKGAVIGQADFTSGPYAHLPIPKGRLHIMLNDNRVYGTAFFIGAPFVKVIPSDWRDLALSEGDTVELRLQTS